MSSIPLKSASVKVFDIEFSQKDKNFILFPREGTMKLNSQVGSAILSQLKLYFDYKNQKAWAEKFSGPVNYRSELDFAEHNEVARTVRAGNLEKTKELLKDKNKRTFLGLRKETLLMLAVESQNHELLEYLLSISKHDLKYDQ